ncbi:unnamed protein product, partial [Haemonchus placei]|uniref:Uncharacterized protein n=1 Tax=Haemonchus placei TaxID=6290 RepID=A0A0N4VVL1_HAEPC
MLAGRGFRCVSGSRHVRTEAINDIDASRYIGEDGQSEPCNYSICLMARKSIHCLKRT